MSKSSTASTSKIPPQLPQKSAWSKGPPQTSASAAASTSASPRSQSPAPSQNATQSPITQSHSRRPSALGQGVSIKEGVSIPRSNVGAANAKQGSAVTFGSIDDAAAPISSSPASVPPIKSEGVKSFGSVPATNSATVNGKASPSFTSSQAGPSSLRQSSSSTSASSPPVVLKASTSLVPKPASNPPSSSSAPGPSPTPTPKLNKVDIRKLFQSPSTAAPAQSSTNPDSSSPALRPTTLPSTSSHPPSSSQSGQPSQPSQVPSFTPFVPSAGFRQPTSTNAPASTSRSPAYQRQMTNGTSGGVGVGNRQSNGPGAPGGPQNVQSGVHSPRLGPPQHGGQPPAGLPPTQQYYPQYFYPTYTVPSDHYMPYPQWMGQHPMPPPPHQPPQGTPGPHPSPLPMSPRNPPPQLQPGTPTQAPTLASPSHPPPSSPSTHIVSHTHTSSISSPPPTPSTTSGPSVPPGSAGANGANGARLNTSAHTFVPKRITIKREDGQEVDIENWRKRDSSSGPTPASPVSSSQKRTTVRMETVEAKNKRLAEEEKERQQKAAAAAAEEAKKAAEEQKRRKEEEEKERLKQEEEEKEKVRREEERKRKEQEEKAKEEDRLRLEEERLKKEEEARLQKEAEERRLEEEARASLQKDDQIEPEEGELVENEPSSDDHATKSEQTAQLRRETLRIDTSLSPDAKRRPGPLDLSTTSKAVVSPPQPSALASARIIEDLGNVPYPDGIMSPKLELNVNAKKGKFRYDRDFLLQFMAVCKEKPESLPPLDAIGLELTDHQQFAMTRGGSGRRQSSTGLPPALSRQASVGLGITGFKPSSSSNFNMGNFATPTSKMTSEERFAMSSGNRVASATAASSVMPFGRPAPIVRSASQGGPGSMGSGRTRSKRGEKRNDSSKVNVQSSSYSVSQANSNAAAMAAFEPVQPLEMSANRWTRNAPMPDQNSPELVERKVKSLLNKLTMEKFEPISDQIITWANKSEKEKDGRTLIQVIKLVFEKATDEAAWSEMYARLCRKMMERISPDVQDDGIKNSEGKPITGGQLFRKYLLNRCQEDFERGWAAKDATATAAAAKASEDEAAKKAAETSGEAELYSDEYYAAQKAKRQGLGLIQFIGELYKLQMLTERIMHECIKKLLGNVDNPEEEEIESLCRLLTTVGQLLDNVKARAHMDIYFSRMKELIKSNNVSSRMQFMLQDLIELRERKWIPRNQVAAPSTLAQVHEAAAKERMAHEKEASTRTLAMSRGGSRRGGDRAAGGEQTQGADGWSVAGGLPRPPTKAGDLSNFGKINKAATMTFGPSSVFAGKKDTKRDSTLSRTSSSSNMFSMLSGGEDPAAAASAAKSSRPSSRRTSVDFGQSGVPEPPAQRRKLQLLPRTRPVEETKANGASEEQSEDESEDDGNALKEAEKKIVEDIKEFFGIRNIDESEEYFSKLDSVHRHLLVQRMVAKAVESTVADAQLVGDAFERAAEKSLCSLSAFEDGFIPTVELLDDIAIDVPKAFDLMAIMMKGAGLDRDEERFSRIVDKLADRNQLISRFH